MSNKRKNDPLVEDDEEGGSGQAGALEFVDFLAPAQKDRDELLTPQEIKQLLAEYANHQEDRVKKQKELRDLRKQLKDGKISKQNYNQQVEKGNYTTQYKVNPILANKAQFSGIDKQNNPSPNENIAETNNEKREELKNEYQLRHRPEQAPRMQPPKPSPYK